tara:strand:+ start:10116 stop:11135 length:1020 start_codon:yes stop_codon:yes gene_type:complete
MKNIFDIPQVDLADIFTQTAIQMGVGLPTIIEKDYWLVKILQCLFTDNDFNQHLVFKGGTSLSKCYGLIQRFSEDVDVTISKKILGFEESTEMVSHFGSTKRKNYFDSLTDASIKYVAKLQGALSEKLQATMMSSDWRLYVDPTEQQNIIFEYPKALTTSMYPDDLYVKPKILLEFGCRGELFPAMDRQVTTYIETIYPEIFSSDPIIVVTLTAERTFWEKVTLLHMLAHQPAGKNLQPRMARHYYDVYKLINSSAVKNKLSDFSLLASVARHKSVYFKSKQASYETAVPGSLRLLPNESLLKVLEADYKAMTEMFFGDVVSFDEIVTSLTSLEKQLNN